MTRMLYIVGVLAILAAGAVLVSCGRQWRSVDPQVAALLAGPGAVEGFAERGRQRNKMAEGQVPPLVVQARALAAYLDPPPPPPVPTSSPGGSVVARTVAPPVRRERAKAAPAVRPKKTSLNFSLRATSYYASEPAKSMALIAEAGGKAGSERWVKQGHELGHFVVHEIRPSSVIFRQGQDLRELAMEGKRRPKSLVRDIRTAGAKVSAAVDEETTPLLTSPPGPNTVEATPGGG